MGLNCTSCGAVVWPVVACDIDGTLGDFHNHFLAFTKSYLGREPALRVAYAGGPEGSFREWMMAAFRISIDTWHDIKLAYRQGGMKRSMMIFPDARGFTDELHNLGVEVWLTTTRPYLRLDNVDPDTRFWLDRHNIYYDHLVYSEDKYRVLREQVQTPRVIAVLDDLPEQYDAASDAFGGGVPILRRNQYNRRVDRPNTVDSLQAARVLIGAKVRKWRSIYE